MKQITGYFRFCITVAFFTLWLAPAPAPAADPDVIICYKTHFDIGYTELAADVITRYRTSMIDGALAVIEASNNNPSGSRFVWTVPGWPMKKILEDWNGQTPQRQGRITDAFKSGRLVLHGFPYTTHTESLDHEDLVRGLVYAVELSKAGELPVPRAAKLTDVPSHSWVLPTLLKKAGIDFLHIGCNSLSSSPDIPRLFFWEGPDGSRLLTYYEARGYGSGITPPLDWNYSTWLAMSMTSDNVGPPGAGVVQNHINQLNAAGKSFKMGELSDFSDLILANDAGSIPVVKGDMPDTWIHGIGSMPIETKAARNYRPLIFALDALNTSLTFWGVSSSDITKTIYSAYEHSLRFGEHTWGNHGSPDLYESEFQTQRNAGVYDEVAASWAEKGQEALTVEELIAPELAGKLKKLAASVNYSGDRIVVYNPLPWKRDGVVQVEVTGIKPRALKDLETGGCFPVADKDTPGKYSPQQRMGFWIFLNGILKTTDPLT